MLHDTSHQKVKNSHHMEPVGLRRCLADMKSKRLKVSTLATDQHLMVIKMLRDEKQYQNVNLFIVTLLASIE